MTTLLQIDFPFQGPFGDAMTAQLAELAASIAEEPGLIWKIWTENAQEQQAGGIYLFQDPASAQAYLEKHTARLNGLGVTQIRARLFDVNLPLSKDTNAPL
ncbi:monooxygenase [Thiohalocapsa marina]|uniref:Monooxygenase n=1 Tax=Thiohalocapsa marina TaxID=424902 RepID=A0A5M8FGB7_9GAMM|nr:monooxygenase [Thiohalocapsa marina]KAA6183464.1 monooxygenase [Thiohalocapsa marina]